MKRNILFGFLLIGLVVMEWGCEKHSGCPDVFYRLLGLSDVEISNQYSRDIRYNEMESISQDSIMFIVSTVKEEITFDFIGNYFSVYATPPCFSPQLNGVDSIRILDENKDVSNEYALITEYDNQQTVKDLRDIRVDDRAREFSFNFRKIHLDNFSLDTVNLSFEFYSNRDSVYTIQGSPIVITP